MHDNGAHLWFQGAHSDSSGYEGLCDVGQVKFLPSEDQKKYGHRAGGAPHILIYIEKLQNGRTFFPLYSHRGEVVSRHVVGSTPREVQYREVSSSILGDDTKLNFFLPPTNRTERGILFQCRDMVVLNNTS